MCFNKIWRKEIERVINTILIITYFCMDKLEIRRWCNMSFNDFSDYVFEFDRLDAKLQNPDIQKKYYNRWMKKYAEIFKSEGITLVVIEWELRCRKALREIFSSATFFIEATKNLEMRCFSSYYFCLYYSLFHAIYSSIFLDVESDINKLLNITHKNIIKIFLSAYGNTKSDIMTSDVKELFISLKYRREYYSYVTPFNNLFNYEEDLKKLKEVLLDCYQLTSFHSLLIEKSYHKNVAKVTKFTNTDEVYEFYELFNRLFSKEDEKGKNKLDPSCEFLREEFLQYGFSPQYIALDLDHQFDEFHTYDGFYDDNSNKDALNASDIWSFVASALI